MPQTEVLERDQISQINSDSTMSGSGTQASPLSAAILSDMQLRAWAVVDDAGLLLDSEGITSWNPVDGSLYLNEDIPATIGNYEQAVGVLTDGYADLETVLTAWFSGFVADRGRLRVRADAGPVTVGRNFTWYLFY